MKSINIKVSDIVAARFSGMTDPEKDNISNLLNEILEDKRTLSQVMEDMSEYAQKKGLTPEMLEDILNEDDE